MSRGSYNEVCMAARASVRSQRSLRGGANRRQSRARPTFVAIAVLLLSVLTSQAADYGTEGEAKAMLHRAVVAMKENKTKALDLFNKGEGGFKDRDLYVVCANASDGVITASPTLKGGQLKDLPPGEEIMRTASEGKVSEIIYWWPRPGSLKPRKKHTFYTKVADQICGVGYYE
jgi:hypothetical protein